MFPDKKFEIEHALAMYADSFVIMPASFIYDRDMLSPYIPIIEKCHIYVIGALPKVETTDMKVSGNKLIITTLVAGNSVDVEWEVPDDSKLVDTHKGKFVEKDGLYWAPRDSDVSQKLNIQHDIMPFDVLYIGQAYGRNGSRNALDRLLKHETLQKISLRGIPENQTLNLLLLEILPSNRLITMMNPQAAVREDAEKRISAGLDKLFGTSEAERVTLFEASLIRYFQPTYNKEFKDSFPSTNLKILSDCYDKDFSAIISEICFDNLPFKLRSSTISPSQYHTASFDLHEDEERKVFFLKD